jgi:DNA-binding transcriptional MerR regulator
LNIKVIPNKIYSYGPDIISVVSVHKKFNKVKIKKFSSEEVIELPLDNIYLFLKRLYTIGEVARIVQRKPDTIRRYERLGHLAPPKRISDETGRKNWRYYTEQDASDMIEFFSERKPPGRPKKKYISNRELRSKIRHLGSKSKIALERLNDC